MADTHKTWNFPAILGASVIGLNAVFGGCAETVQNRDTPTRSRPTCAAHPSAPANSARH